jgi:hypothetical protein
MRMRLSMATRNPVARMLIWRWKLHAFLKNNIQFLIQKDLSLVKKVMCTLVQALRLFTGRTAHTGSRGIALLFLDHCTRRGEGSASLPGHSLPLGKTRYPLYRRLGGPQGQSGQLRKISSPPGFDPQAVQPIASRYTDWATGPTIFGKCFIEIPTGTIWCCNWGLFLGINELNAHNLVL